METIVHEEYSAGGIVKTLIDNDTFVLLIRIRKQGLEIPKGHIEEEESDIEAAIREIREETGLITPIEVDKELDILSHQFEKDGKIIKKITKYFSFQLRNNIEPVFEKKPKNTREVVWLNKNHLRLSEIKYPDLKRLVDIVLDQ